MKIKIKKECIKNIEDFKKLEKGWQHLLNNIPNHSIFLTWEWMYIWWKTYHDLFIKPELRILVYYYKQTLIGILPYYSHTEKIGIINIRKLSFLGTQIESSDYLDFIYHPNYRDYFKKYLLSDLKYYNKDIDIIEVNNCLKESFIYNIIMNYKDSLILKKLYRVCPYVNLPNSFNDYLKTLSPNFRYNVRRRVKNLFEKKGAKWDIVDDYSQIDQEIKDVFNLHYLRAKQKNLKTKFIRELRMEFHQKVTSVLARKNYIKIFNIRIEGEKIASLYCFSYGGVLAYFQAGFDPAWSKYSPGLVNLAKAIEYAINNKKQIFDFMRGEEKYKKDWGTTCRCIYLLSIPNSLKGFIILLFYKYCLQVYLFLKNKKSILPKKFNKFNLSCYASQ